MTLRLVTQPTFTPLFLGRTIPPSTNHRPDTTPCANHKPGTLPMQPGRPGTIHAALTPNASFCMDFFILVMNMATTDNTVIYLQSEQRMLPEAQSGFHDT